LYNALEQAYENVLSQARKAFGAQAPAPVQVMPEKVKAASGSINGAPTNGVIAKKRKPKTLDEALDMAEEMVGGR